MIYFSFTWLLGLWALLATTALATEVLKGKQYENQCSYTTWKDETSTDSPLITDCLKIARNYENSHSGWFLTGAAPETFAQLGSYGTCGFGVRPVVKKGIKKTNLFFGSTDIHDLIFDATRKFKRYGRIGASGVAHCGDTDVNWGIYRV